MPSKSKKKHLSKPKASNRNILTAVIVIVAALIIGIGLYKINQPTYTLTDVSLPPLPTPSPIMATFNCAGGKSIQATFAGNNVSLVLSDGRKLSLPHAISADGARYANKNETFVFWNVGNTAFIEENGTQTYSNCVQG
jgi:membrane-bound inhibitor of C-type lysozyme